MRRFAAVLLIFNLIVPSLALGADETPLAGYSPRSSQTERDWETKFRAIPDPANLKEYMRRLSARPHHVGSPYDKDNAEWILARFKEWGLDAHIETFDVLFPTPKVRVLEMIEPTKFTAKLEEPALAVDPTSNQKSEQLPTYNAYSIDGDVTAPLVFVNYGLPEDYEKLDRLGISVKGAIVIAKYYHSWRGVKPKVAAEHGAIGCLIYSEPQDDGYTRDNVFPQGPDAQSGRRAARQRDGLCVVESRRPAHSRHRRHARRQAAGAERREEHHEDSRCCRFPTATRSLCSPRSKGRWRPTSGAEACPSPTTLDRGRRKFI